MIEQRHTSPTADTPKPFWQDMPEYEWKTFKVSKIASWLVIAAGVVMVLAVFGISFGLVYQVSHIGGWIVLIYFVGVFGWSIINWFIQKRKLKFVQEETDLIQEKARQKSSAIVIGSAVHVAGDPKLEREQKIVLALTKSTLDIYSYDQVTAVDSIPLNQIVAVHTVVYDDDRIPHLDTVDRFAQAMQLSVKHGDVVYDLLFRSMRKVRPIDWYQAIQKARMQPAGDQFHLDRE